MESIERSNELNNMKVEDLVDGSTPPLEDDFKQCLLKRIMNSYD